MAAASAQATTSPVSLSLPPDFEINPVDIKFHKKTAGPSASKPPPLGVLSNFKGNFAGHGFNMIFRPQDGSVETSTFPNSVPVGDNVLEINLTQETLSFANSLGKVPNRGEAPQADIFLNGVPYTQVVSDVINPHTGKADGTPVPIHFENGIWMHVPKFTSDPNAGESLVRMGSIPHGTTINAQCLQPTSSTKGPPSIPQVDMTPFTIQGSQPIPFASQTASNADTARIPQDLTNFIKEGTINQAILTDVNTTLRSANTGKTITETTTFTVTTDSTAQELGGGTTNISFLVGNASGPNANAVKMSATFWIETVEHKLTVPAFKPGQKHPLKLSPPEPFPGALVPVFVVEPPKLLTEPKTITVKSTQIQYSQLVILNFANLSWPHISTNTLVPTTEQIVPHSAFD